MKLSIVGLLVLGLFAAACAAILIALLAVRRPGGGPLGTEPEVNVLVAKYDIEPNTMIDGNAVMEQKVPRSKVPEQALSASVQAIGKVTKMPVLEGQAFRKDMFVTEGSGSQLAASFGAGKRAVAISLSEAAGLDGVLYPGSVVDVILTIKGARREMPSRSRTVLEGVPVLAIERQTVIAKDAEKQDGGESKRHGTNARRVTLLVTSHQANVVQLALNEGTLSLAMRNPLDKNAPDRSAVSMTEVMPEENGASDWMAVLGRVLRAGGRAPAPAVTAPVSLKAAEQPAPVAAVPDPKAKVIWQTQVIRGTSVEKVDFTDAETPQ